jgi:hypothetical protein
MRGRPDDPTPDNVDRPEMHPDQLKPGVYPPYNHVMHGPPGTDVGSIWTNIAQDSQGFGVTSVAYNLDDRQRAMIEAGAHVQVNMWQVPMPPISVAVEGPYCECHDAEMVFDEHDGGFRCAAQQEVGNDSSPLEAARRDFKPEEDARVPEPGPDDASDGPAAPDAPVGG